MIVKYVLLSILCLIFITAADPYFGTEFSLKPLPKEKPGDVREMPWMSTEAFRPYLLDHDDRVSDLFPVTSYYYPTVHFWFLIYTQFNSSQVVIHDKNNLSLIYKVLDFSQLQAKGLPKNTLYVLQQKLSEEKMDDIKKELATLVKDPFSLSPEAREINRIIAQAKIQLPINKSERSKFFANLRENIRTQTGQKNFIRDGIVRSQPYQGFLSKYFEDRKLPKELLAIPFLESSFNPRAQSKVNALGIWQFMPLISSYYVPKRNDHYDYRFNVGVASVAAGFLMSENYKIMKSWDLTVTAYNSGTKHLLKTKRELASDNVNLERIIKHSDSAHFGFASKNFYSEFLALAHTLAYREDLFDNLHESDRADVEHELKFYMTKCPLQLAKELKPQELDDLYYHNHHTTDDNQARVPRGFILISKSKMPKNKFYEIAYKDVLKNKPKDWDKLLGHQSCSTR